MCHVLFLSRQLREVVPEMKYIIDLETYSEADLELVGSRLYADRTYRSNFTNVTLNLDLQCKLFARSVTTKT